MNPAEIEEPDKDFMVVAIDLMSSVVEGLGPDVGNLLVRLFRHFCPN